MDNLTKNPMLLVGVLVVLAVVMVAGKAGGPTYAVTATDPAAFKARADAQAVTDASLTDARQGLITGIIDYAGQRDSYRLGMAELRSSYDLGVYQIGSNERVSMAGIGLSHAGLQSAERVDMATIGAGERMNAVDNQTAREGQRWDFGKAVLNIVPNILKLFGLGA